MSKHTVNNLDPEANIEEALEFLRQRSLKGPWDICAITPDGPITSRSFGPDSVAALRQFLSERVGRENCYVHVNPLHANKKDIKAKKADISHADWLHVDIDDLDGLSRLTAFSLAPTVVVFSGGGYNAYWKLEKPIDDFDLVERANGILVKLLDGDPAATDISRILRLPGTINLPTQKKLKKGRVAAAARIVSEATDWRRSYDISEFLGLSTEGKVFDQKRSALQPFRGKVSLTPAEFPNDVSERIRDLILHGDDRERPRSGSNPRYRSRSECVFAVACALIRLGHEHKFAASVLINRNYRISESLLEKKNPDAEATRQVERAAFAVADGWPEGLADRSNFPRRTFQNTQSALLKLGLSFWFDEFRQRMFVSGQPLQAYQGELNDRVCSYLRDLVNKEFGFDPGKDMARDSIEQLCNQNSVDPVKEYLASLKWDEVPRLDKWLIDYASAEETAYVCSVGAIFLIAAVRRVRRPGTKFDTILVLEGPQGSGKSTLIRTLASDEFFSDQDILAADNKTQMEMLEGIWLYELCELAGMRHAEVNKIKAFASRVADRARPAYARHSENRPRRVVFIGTTNDDAYLKDETGNRRFWPVRTGAIDLDGLQADRDQLWAEAAEMEANDASITLPKELWPVAAAEQLKRVEADGWQIVLENVKGRNFNGRELVTSLHLLTEILDIPKGQITPYQYRRLRRTMTDLGWHGSTTLVLPGGVRRKGYWRETTQPDDPADGYI